MSDPDLAVGPAPPACVHYEWRVALACFRADRDANTGIRALLGLALYRLGHTLWIRGEERQARNVLAWPLFRLAAWAWASSGIGAAMSVTACAGPGLGLPGGGRGVVVGDDVKIGEHVVIGPGVTVRAGVGVGDRAVVRAGSVLAQDVGAG